MDAGEFTRKPCSTCAMISGIATSKLKRDVQGLANNIPA